MFFAPTIYFLYYLTRGRGTFEDDSPYKRPPV
jgi:hypothetical protein